jgi:hypothetical protein
MSGWRQFGAIKVRFHFCHSTVDRFQQKAISEVAPGALRVSLDVGLPFPKITEQFFIVGAPSAPGESARVPRVSICVTEL